MISSKKRLPSPTKQTPCPAISVIAHNLAIVKAIQKVSFETIDRIIERQHQLGMDHVQKLSESLTRMSAPLPETPALTMPDDEAIHEEYHIPMTADRLVTTAPVVYNVLCKFPPCGKIGNR